MRTVSPNAVHTALRAKRTSREKQKQERMHKLDENYRKARERAMFAELRSDFAAFEPSHTDG